MNFFKKLLFGTNSQPDKKSSNSGAVSSRAHYQRGVDLDNARNVSEAIKEFTKAIEIDNFPMAYYCRACIYQDMKLYANAIVDFRNYMKYGPKSSREYIASRVCIEELEQKLR